VVVFHILQWLNGGLEVARAGVDVFFVISGFIIWTVTAPSDQAPGVFLWRRVTRVVPAYWIATLLLAAIVLVWPPFLPKVHPRWGHLILSLALIPHFDTDGRPFPLLAPGWTLSYEAAFYLIFAACLAAPRSVRARAATAGLAGVVALGFFLSDPAYILLANPLLLEFAAGLWIGVAFRAKRLPNAAWSGFLFTAGLAAFAVYGLTAWRDEAWRAATWGIPAAFIVAGAVGLEARLGAFRSAVLKSLGDASYSIYLFHPIAVAAMAHTLGTGQPWLFIPAALAAAIAAGLAGRAMVEKPLIALLRSSR
jgi:exopolysaccharide production protein ExoZ